jgi:hypothetical protein
MTTSPLGWPRHLQTWKAEPPVSHQTYQPKQED